MHIDIKRQNIKNGTNRWNIKLGIIRKEWWFIRIFKKGWILGVIDRLIEVMWAIDIRIIKLN